MAVGNYKKTDNISAITKQTQTKKPASTPMTGVVSGGTVKDSELYKQNNPNAGQTNETPQISDLGAIKTTFTPETSNDVKTPENDSVITQYANEVKKMEEQKQAVGDSTLADTEKDALNKKIQTTNDYINAYMNSTKTTQSAKVQSALAQQEASNATKNYMSAVGLGGQGISESSQIALGNNYANAQNQIVAEGNANNASLSENYMNNISDINADKASAIKDTQSANSQNIANGLVSSVDVNGNIDISVAQKYKEMADQMYNNGELNKADYDNILSAYEQALKESETAKGEINTILAQLGVKDYTPVKNGTKEITKGDIEGLKDWLKSEIAVSDSNLNTVMNKILSAEDGSVVELGEEGNNGKYAVYNGKLYVVEAPSKSSNSNSNNTDWIKSEIVPSQIVKNAGKSSRGNLADEAVKGFKKLFGLD